MSYSDSNDSIPQILRKWCFIFIEHFWRGMTSTLLFQTFLLIAIQAFLYVVADNTTKKVDFFMGFGLFGFAMFALNVAIIYAFTLTLLRGLISPLIFMITTVLYTAGVKYLTGTLFLGIALKEFWMIMPIAGYIFIMTYFDAMLRGELQTAITYRTTDDD